MKRPACASTRCFDPTIHPKKTAYDLFTIRLQVRKHRCMTWPMLAKLFKTADWMGLFLEPRVCSPRGQTLVLSYRIRAVRGDQNNPVYLP